MLPYIFILTATLLFSVEFLFTKKYQLVAGTNTEASFFQKMVAPIMFVIILFFYNKCELHITTFSFALALINAVICNLIMFFSIKALAGGSIANYTLYLLCGGMVLPVVYGAAIGDSFDVWKGLSLLLIFGAIAVKFDGKEKANRLVLFCSVMLFLLNGAVGIVSAVHQGELFDFDKVSALEFSMLNSLLSIILGGVVFGVIYVKKRREIDMKAYVKATPWAMCDGILNGVANLLLLLSLKDLAPSLQYPMITGGSIFLSAVFGLIVYREKPSKRVWTAVFLALVGTALMAMGDLCF